MVGHHGHGAPKQSVRKPSLKREHKITFDGIKPDKDPDEGMIVMKGKYLFYLPILSFTLSFNCV